MKKTPLRRKSKSSRRKLIDMADRKLQDFFREKYKGQKCEICLIKKYTLKEIEHAE